jgi:hypothetical protein
MKEFFVATTTVVDLLLLGCVERLRIHDDTQTAIDTIQHTTSIPGTRKSELLPRGKEDSCVIKNKITKKL